MPEVRIQVPIDVETEKGRFVDALYFSLSEYQQMSEQDVQDEIDNRVAAWVSLRVQQDTQEPEPLTEEEKQELINQHQIEIERLSL